MSNMSSFWSSFGLGNTASKGAKAQAQLQSDLRYLYSAFTMIPCLRLSPDRKARLINGYEEFPFDTAVPLVAFKNVSALEICDLDFRSFFGWDRLADQLRSLIIKRGQLDDLLDLLVHIVLDDMDKRRRRSSTKTPNTPPVLWQSSSPHFRHSEIYRVNSPPASPGVDDPRFGSSASPRNNVYLRGDSDISIARSPRQARNKSLSPSRPASGRPGSSYRHVRGGGDRMKRSGSGSSNSSTHSLTSTSRNRSSSNLLSMGILPASKWRFLRHLCIADNGLTELTASGLSPLSNSLVSLDLSSNLFTEVPDCLAMLTALRALNLSNCMLKSLHSLARSPLPAITALNLRANRLISIAGIERLLSLERLDIRDNRIMDPTEIARITGIPDMRELWVTNNPFVKSHSSYRVTIFNLFRASPGYTEDIIIDNAGPGYSERRQLHDRATEASAPLNKPPSIDFELPPTSEPAMTPQTQGHPLLGARPLPHASQSEMAIGSGRRRKGAKRRIVDLSAEEAQAGKMLGVDLEPTFKVPRRDMNQTSVSSDPVKPSPSHPLDLEENPFLPGTGSLKEDESFDGAPDKQARSISSGASRRPDNPALTLTNEMRQMSIDGDAYRQKVQALKDEFGSSWLRMLNAEGWQVRSEPQMKDTPFPHASAAVVRQDLSSIRTPSQGIVSGSRTIG